MTDTFSRRFLSPVISIWLIFPDQTGDDTCRTQSQQYIVHGAVDFHGSFYAVYSVRRLRDKSAEKEADVRKCKYYDK